MKNKRIAFLLIDKPISYSQEELRGTKLGLYSSLPNRYGGTSILIKPNNKYEFVRSGCFGGSLDSGEFSIQTDTFSFASEMGQGGNLLLYPETEITIENDEIKPPPPPPIFDEIANVENFVLRDNVFFSTMDSGLVLYKIGIEHWVVIVHRADRVTVGSRISSKGRVIEDGEFKDSILFNGRRYKYLKDYNEEAIIYKIDNFAIIDSFPQ